MDKKQDITVVLYGKLVNVNNWASHHPGGLEVLKAFHERDATEQFEAMHTSEARKKLIAEFLINSPPISKLNKNERQSKPIASAYSGSPIWNPPSSAIKDNYTPFIVSSTDINPISKDFAKFRQQLEEKGLFKPNMLKEFLMFCYTLSMYILGGYLIFYTEHSYLGLFLLLLGLHQSGWVSHDYLHHSILPSVYWNDVVGGFLGTLQGYDRGWWKARHNAHHVNTNECLHDPDVSVAPILHFVQQFPDLKSRLNKIQKYQHYYFLPFLTLLDLDWRFESIVFAAKVYPQEKLPAFKLLAHYIVAAGIVYIVGIWPAISILLARGFMLGIIVFSNHYAEQRYNSIGSLSFAEQIAYSTRNIGGGFLMNFFTGNVSLQIEHHLFPTMPPQNLAKVSPLVQTFLKKHSLPYNESSLVSCLTILIHSLNMHEEA